MSKQKEEGKREKAKGKGRGEIALMVETAIGGIAALGIASYFGYATMAPRSQLYGRTFLGEAPGSRRLALTFDDGPNDPHTLRLLEVLAKHNVKATFFMIGCFVQEHPEIAEEVARQGHTIGNHTFSHPNLIFCTGGTTEDELLKCATSLGIAVGKHSNLFRPPFGGRRTGVLRVARKLGYEPVMWTVTCYDWRKGISAERIVANAVRQVCGGDVILLHDGSHVRFGADRSQTVEATDRLIARYKGGGYEFVSVAEMMGKGT